MAKLGIKPRISVSRKHCHVLSGRAELINSFTDTIVPYIVPYIYFLFRLTSIVTKNL